jgi:hypothetical protein
VSLPQEDSIIPVALQPARFDRVLPARERTSQRRATRDLIQPTTDAPQASNSTLILGAIAALVLLALPLPLLLDGTVSVAPRMGLLGLFVVPPVIFMAVVQSRYGSPTK